MTEDVGLRVRSRRKELGLTQGDVADRVGVTKAAISQWEAGTAQVLGKNLVKLAAALETSAQWLMSGQETDARHPIEVERLAQVLMLLESLPKSQSSALNQSQRAKLIAYLYSRNLSQVKKDELSDLLMLVK